MTNPADQLSDEDIIRRLNLGGLIKDWGGFERLVADLNSTGDVTVKRNVKLKGKSGATRQIDVLIRHKQGLIEHLVVIECKHWRERVSRAEVDALATTVREVNASRGVLFSVQGFESGAITQAKAEGIELFTVRELTDQEWGAPGRHVDFHIHVISKAIDGIEIPNFLVGNIQSSQINFDLRFGALGPELKHPIQPHEGTTAKTLEELMVAIALKAGGDMWKPAVFLDGKPGKRQFWRRVESRFNTPIIVSVAGGYVMLPQLNFKLGLQIHQSRFQFDRGAKYAFALAVQDEVRGVTNAASREAGKNETTLTTLSPSEEAKDKGPALVNGSIMSVWVAGMFPFDEVRGLAKGEYLDTLAA